MRKLLLSLLMVFGFAIVASAQTQDVVYLNNGSIIKGKIVEKYLPIINRKFNHLPQRR